MRGNSKRPKARAIARRSSGVVIESIERRLLMAAGLADTSFSGDGFQTAIYRNSQLFIDAAVQSDGKIVAVGQTATTGQTYDFVVARFLTNGNPDTTFGARTGRVIVNISTSTDDSAAAVAIQTDGKIVVAGTTGKDMFAERFTTAGAVDATFGAAGRRIIDFGGNTDSAADVLVQSDGKIVISGGSISGSTTSPSALHSSVALVRLTSAGALDTTFAGNGKFQSNTGLGFLEFGFRMAQVGTSYVVAGTKASYTGVAPNVTFSNAQELVKIKAAGLWIRRSGLAGAKH